MTGERIIIRALNAEADISAWTSIHNQRAVASGTLRIPFTPDSLWKQRFDANRMERILVAEIDGRVVGGAGFEVYLGRRHHSGTFGMGVDVEFQGQGVGSALMAAIVDLADNWYNLRRLELEVHADNAAGIALYKKFGFEVEGLYRKYSYRNGEFVDALPMARIRPDPWFSADTMGR